jgi:hypothetical protein
MPAGNETDPRYGARNSDFRLGDALLYRHLWWVTALEALTLPRTAKGRAVGGCRGSTRSVEGVWK